MVERMLRRGLPRVASGEAWPPAEAVEAAAPVEAAVRAETAPAADTAPAAPRDETKRRAAGETIAETAADVSSPPTSSPSLNDRGGAALRRGLPRTPGSEPWPPPFVERAAGETKRGAEGETKRHDEAPAPAPVASEVSSPPLSSPPLNDREGETLRRGLPRSPGSEPWPPADVRAVASTVLVVDESNGSVDAPVAVAASVDAALVPADAAYDVSTPLPYQRTVFPGKYAFARPARAPEPERIGPFTKGQWAGAVIVGGAGLLVAAALAVLFVRWLLSLEPLQDFQQTYPGEYHLPEGAPIGFPAWLGWQHFFNVFLMVLIIRSGLRIRTEKRPTAFWTPRGDAKGKVSLTIWFHQSLDILWLVNGVVFIVLLFVTGQWMRVIPTSWEVIPNALSAVLQYVSLDWPTENGWVNYNSLQQIAYFATIFLAAPLAAITGYRMSGMWPKNAEKLNKLYPIEWARAVHFPVMLYFVAFIFVHVALVLSTGAIRNLNHMYAAQGSVDPNAYADNWTGFWLFVASLVVIAAAWVAARPLVLAPIAKLFGTVSSR